ncbi:MAG TPA: hypothetical protein ENK02_10350 [Planctomycetes bacterium]|nr:hypothetical protein [Planctomycetota bacterium]
MSETVRDPAQKIFVQRFIDWELVSKRILQFKNIAKAFPLEVLKVSRPPYHCHPMAWRLGVWSDECFPYLDRLLEIAGSLPNWDTESSLCKSLDFSDFWSWYWQIQVASFLKKAGALCVWRESGPDLEIGEGGGRFFIECYCPRKSFGVIEFIREVMGQICPRIKVEAKFWSKIDINQKAKDLNELLDSLFSPLLNEDFLRAQIKKSNSSCPHYLEIPEGFPDELLIYIEGEDRSRHDLNLEKSNIGGNPEDYLSSHYLSRVISAKLGKNDLVNCRPNVLAINLLLDKNAETAQQMRGFEEPKLNSELDAILYGFCGINAKGFPPGMKFYSGIAEHPILEFISPPFFAC